MQDNENLDVMKNEDEGTPQESEDMTLGDGGGTPEDGETGDGGGTEDGETSGDGESTDGENGDEFLDGGALDEGGDISGIDTGMLDGGMMSYGGGMSMGETGTETAAKDPILSNVPFVAITITAALAAGIVLGVLLGRKRIKKGFDSYED